MVTKDCVPPRQARIARAAIIGIIRLRKLRQKDVAALCRCRPQHLHDVLHEGKPISLRMHAAFKRAIRKAFPDLAA
jgi:hypothetical protein